MARAHLLILNYNGADILGETLPTLQAAMAQSKHECRLSVIDNASPDKSVDFLKEHFKNVTIYRQPNRLLCSYNEVLEQIDEEWVILLNNDLKVAPDFLDLLLDPFLEDPLLFMVSPSNRSYDGRQSRGGPCRAWMSFGIFKAADIPENKSQKITEAVATFAAGSAGAYDRKKFLALGGYDDLYLPGTVEDTDLCFRAWKRGYRCLYEARSVVYHEGQRSFRKAFGVFGTAEMNARNIYLFMWKNFEDPRLWVEHLICLPLRLVGHLLRGQLFWITGFVKALGRLPEVLKRRRLADRALWKRTDKEVIAIV